jgi:hypothetical protein
VLERLGEVKAIEEYRVIGTGDEGIIELKKEWASYHSYALPVRDALLIMIHTLIGS